MAVVERIVGLSVFFFNDTATTEIYTLSLHDALPISDASRRIRRITAESRRSGARSRARAGRALHRGNRHAGSRLEIEHRSEEHTSELQSRLHLVCRLLLEKKNKSLRPPPT